MAVCFDGSISRDKDDRLQSHTLARTQTQQTQQTHTPDLQSGCGELRVVFILHLNTSGVWSVY